MGADGLFGRRPQEAPVREEGGETGEGRSPVHRHQTRHSCEFSGARSHQRTLGNRTKHASEISYLRGKGASVSIHHLTSGRGRWFLGATGGEHQLPSISRQSCGWRQAPEAKESSRAKRGGAGRGSQTGVPRRRNKEAGWLGHHCVSWRWPLAISLGRRKSGFPS